jgi:hypothetical protein
MAHVLRETRTTRAGWQNTVMIPGDHLPGDWKRLFAPVTVAVG